MHTDVYTLNQTQTIKEAIHLMEMQAIRHIPIINSANHVIGIVSDRDIRDIRPSTLTSDYDENLFLEPISIIMSTPVLTGHEDDDVQESARLFYQNRIGCLPIIKDGKLTGIITESDMLYSMTKLLGADRPSSVIEVCVKNKTGMLADVSAIFKKSQVNIVSAVAYSSEKQGHHMLSFRVQTIDPRRVIRALQNEGYDVYGPASTPKEGNYDWKSGIDLWCRRTPIQIP